jgi:hypothetical protein
MTGYIWIDNEGNDAYVYPNVFWTRTAAEEALERWMLSQYEVTKHEDGNYYDKEGGYVQAYVKEIYIPD